MTTNNSYITAGAGKTNPTLRQLTRHPMVYTTCSGKTKRMGEIVYVTTREEVERQDISRMLLNFGPQQSRQKLRQLRGRIIFTVDGYDTAGDIFEIPEVRNYYGLVHRMWPSWLFSSCLASPSLRVIALSVIPNMSIIHSKNLCRIQIPESDLREFFVHSLPAAVFLHCKSGIPRHQGAEYLRIVSKHLGSPEE